MEVVLGSRSCTLLLRPIFAEMTKANGQMPSATPEELAGQHPLHEGLHAQLAGDAQGFVQQGHCLLAHPGVVALQQGAVL